jgi:hypothetical protein
MGTFFTIFLISFAIATAGKNSVFWLWSDAHHTLGWFIFVGLFAGVAYLMAESKAKGASKTWEPRFQKFRNTVNSFTRRG